MWLLVLAFDGIAMLTRPQAVRGVLAAVITVMAPAGAGGQENSAFRLGLRGTSSRLGTTIDGRSTRSMAAAFGVSADLTYRLARGLRQEEVGLRIDYDQVSGFEFDEGAQGPGSNRVSYHTGSLWFAPFCRSLCVAFSAGAGRASHQVHVKSAEASNEELFRPGGSPVWRIGLSIEVRMSLPAMLVLARYGSTVSDHRGGGTDLSAWIIGLGVSPP